MARRTQIAMDLTGAPARTDPAGPVTCLGIEFADDAARRAHYTDRLRACLEDPAFRATPGFPAGTTADILRMSDPPYYTACPNPFLAEFVAAHGTPYDPAAEADAPYRREPLAIDTSVGKTDNLYKAHGYHTKVPHLAIVPSILHYTRPGDLVLDGFAGSGMTGVAAQWCGAAPEAYRLQVETDRGAMGLPAPEWGARRAILNDLGPAATFIAAGFNLPFDLPAFAREARRILDEVDAEVGWMYETLHSDGVSVGRINYTVWSEVASCPACAGDVVFTDEALDAVTKRVATEFPCPHCGAVVSKRRLTKAFDVEHDPVIGTPRKIPRRVPVLVNYEVDGKTCERRVTPDDIAVLTRIDALPYPIHLPTTALPYMHMTHERAKMSAFGITHTHHFFLRRQAHALAALWRRATAIPDPATRRMVVWFAEQAIWGISALNRYQPLQQGRPGGSQVNRQLSGVYYVPSQISECSPWYNLEGRLQRLVTLAFPTPYATAGAVAVTTGDCAHLGVPDRSVDYVFTDPPFGENIYYADLNFLVESWHGVATRAETEAIVDRAKGRDVHGYQALMRACFAEYFRVLKPGRWMTVVFSNSSNAVWRAIQEAIGAAGFVVADVRSLDKQQGSYRQVTSSAVKQDLVISAYRPTVALETVFALADPGPASAWAFVDEHLRNVPVFVGRRREVRDAAGQVTAIVEEADTQAERTAPRLFDRMIAFHVQRHLSVPLGSAEFRAGLDARYPVRDGMYFLPVQVPGYDRKRKPEAVVQLLSFSVADEASAIQWVRQQLATKPQNFQDLQPTFMREQVSWSRHERPVELRDLLDENFLQYDGTGEVPSQVHAYLSTNYHALRNLPKDAPALVVAARDRWYVPDPGKQADLEQVRTRALLREYAGYLALPKAQLKAVRTDAIRAGFAQAWKDGRYDTIVALGDKVPAAVVQEDETVGMYYDNAVTLVRG